MTQAKLIYGPNDVFRASLNILDFTESQFLSNKSGAHQCYSGLRQKIWYAMQWLCGMNPAEIAKFSGRDRSGIYRQIKLYTDGYTTEERDAWLGLVSQWIDQYHSGKEGAA